MAVVGLDIGSGGCKCTIFNEDGKVSALSFMEYELQSDGHGYYELNPNTVWEAVCHVCKSAISQHKGSDVKALCITSFGESGVLMNKSGQVLYNSLMYSDRRGEQQCQRLTDRLGAKTIMKKSGHSPHPMFSVSKLMWIKDNEPEIFNEADTFLQYSDFILYKLSNEKYIDWSLASRTMLFDVENKKWDSVLLEAAGLKEGMFAKPVQAGKIVATISRQAAELTGFPVGTALLLGGQDQVGAAIGAGILKLGQAVNGMGSVDCITPVFDKPIINSSMAKYGYACVPYALKDHYVTYAFNFSGGALLRWYRDKFAEHEKSDAEKKGCSVFEVLESMMPKEPTDILVLPHWQGAATPYMDIHSVGAIVGMDMNTDRYVLYRALMEGVAYEAKMNIDALAKAGIKIEHLTACGGGSRSNSWLQLRADIFNIPIDVLEFEEAGTLGAAVMAGVACGMFDDIEDGVQRLVRTKKTYTPNTRNHHRYIGSFSKYKKIYQHIKQIVEE